MAQKLYEETNIQSIADAIRAKNGSTDTYKTSEMAAAISAISTGGGGIPEEALTLTGDGKYRFAYDGWNWFIDTYKNQIDMTGLTSFAYLCYQSKNITEFPYTLTLTGSSFDMSMMFHTCSKLTTLPTFTGGFTSTPKPGDIKISYLLYQASCVRDAENLFSECDLSELTNIKVTSAYTYPDYSNFLYSASSLRKLPTWVKYLQISEESTAMPTYYGTPYHGGFQYCYALDEITNFPVVKSTGAQTSNMFSNFCNACYRLKNLTFETQEDGSPYVVKWKTQTIDLAGKNIGYCTTGGVDNLTTKFNSGITTDKRVTNDATYAALKDDPDWWTTNMDYSRYNHDSAVATINSLPDTSAYLATAGGTNTIKFEQYAGGKTDGGLIANLTEEEIAVATAKGWTVTLV